MDKAAGEAQLAAVLPDTTSIQHHERARAPLRRSAWWAGLVAFVPGIAQFACEHSDAPLSVRSHRRAHVASRLDIIRLLGCVGLGFPPRRQQGGGLLDRAGPVLGLSPGRRNEDRIPGQQASIVRGKGLAPRSRRGATARSLTSEENFGDVLAGFGERAASRNGIGPCARPNGYRRLITLRPQTINCC